MDNLSQKPQVRLMVRRSSKKIPKSSEKKKIRVARKLRPSPNSPNPVSIQEDLLLESKGKIIDFLSLGSLGPDYELLKSHNSLSPTDVVGSYNRFNLKNFVKTSNYPKHAIKNITLNKTFRPSSPTLEQKLTERRLKFKEDYDKKIKDQKVNKPLAGAEETLLRQTRSLEKYSKQRDYWDMLENNLTEKLSKNPEELMLNSAKEFEEKKKEIELIDNLYKINEVRPNGFWQNSLRRQTDVETLLKSVSPEIDKNKQLNRYKTDNLFSAKYTDYGRKQLKSSEYFQRRLKEFDKKGQELLHSGGNDLAIFGVNKIRLEYDAVRKSKNKKVTLPQMELFCEEIIAENYDARVLSLR